MAASGERAAIEKHIRTCRECAALIADQELPVRLHARLGRIEPPAGMTGRIVDAAWEIDRRRGLARAALVAAAAALVVLLGIGAGSLIVRSHFAGAREGGYAAYTGLEYLDVYPPDSIGEAIQLAAGGEADE